MQGARRQSKRNTRAGYIECIPYTISAPSALGTFGLASCPPTTPPPPTSYSSLLANYKYLAITIFELPARGRRRIKKQKISRASAAVLDPDSRIKVYETARRHFLFE